MLHKMLRSESIFDLHKSTNTCPRIINKDSVNSIEFALRTSMSDIKLFRLNVTTQVEELTGKFAKLEKDLQILVEQQMETFLGVRFLATEYTTSNKGRIDSLGLDENGCPVIIEYKRHANENVINQGLFYLNWLLDHKADFQLLVMKVLDTDAAESIEWSGARLICIASDFNKYDEHAIQLIDRNIELMRYKYFSDDLLLLELVNSQSSNSSLAKPKDITSIANGTKPSSTKKSNNDWTHIKAKEQASAELTKVYDAIGEYCESLGDEVIRKELKLYTAYKRIRNFISICIDPQKDARVTLWLKVEPSSIKIEKNFTRDVTNIGHWGTGDLEVSIRSIDDFEKAKPLIEQSYLGS
jgi:predicted transport protein